MAKEITVANFEAEIINAGVPALVDFWAPWCGPCKAIGPIIEEVATEMAGKAVVGKINVDSNQELAMRYGVQAIPTIIIFKSGVQVDRIVGTTSKEDIIRRLEAQK